MSAKQTYNTITPLFSVEVIEKRISEIGKAMFQRFTRGDKARHLPGNGLGLSLVAAVIGLLLAAPIGSGLGIQNFTALRILREQITTVPLIVDAGVGTASDAALAMELGFDGILMNTAVAEAQDAAKMALAMNHGVQVNSEFGEIPTPTIGSARRRAPPPGPSLRRHPLLAPGCA